jgi:hypothetical protein
MFFQPVQSIHSASSIALLVLLCFSFARLAGCQQASSIWKKGPLTFARHSVQELTVHSEPLNEWIRMSWCWIRVKTVEKTLAIFTRISFYLIGNRNKKVRNGIRSIKFGQLKMDKSE